MNTNPLRTLVLIALSLCAFAAIAGPPLLCNPFDTAGAPSLAWGGPRWNQARADYDLRTLSANTEALLTAKTPVIARMETLRRAAIYASRDAAVATQLLSRLDARITRATTTSVQSLALFDSGYFTETLEEVVRLQGYDMPGVGKADTDGLRALLAKRDGDAQVDAAITLRPNDPAMRFAAALIASADQRKTAYATHAAFARAAAAKDPLLARNLQQIAN